MRSTRARWGAALLVMGVILLIGRKIWIEPDQGTSNPPIELLRSALELREDGRLYAPGAEQPFDGLLIENFTQEKRKLEIEIHAGQAHGTSRGWFEDGQIEVQETFVHGVSNGQRTRWYLNGNKRSEVAIIAGVLEGNYLEWDQHGNQIVSMTLRNGQPDGLAEAWHPSGAIKSRTRFENGKQVEQQFFSDGESALNRVGSLL